MGVFWAFTKLGMADATKTDLTLDFLAAFTTSKWKATFFSGEMLGIFLYTIFAAKANDNEGVPSCLWGVFLVTVAQICGASVFFPANAFVEEHFVRFISAQAWTTVFFQLLSSFLAQLVLEFVWN